MFFLNDFFFAVYQRIEKTSVYEIVLQLYNEAWVNGMQDPNNLVRQNMTDQMLHLVSISGGSSHSFLTISDNQNEREGKTFPLYKT